MEVPEHSHDLSRFDSGRVGPWVGELLPICCPVPTRGHAADEARAACCTATPPPRPLHLKQPICAAQLPAAVDRVAQQQDRQPQRGVPQQLGEHRQHRFGIHEQPKDDRSGNKPGGNQERPPQIAGGPGRTAPPPAATPPTCPGSSRRSRPAGSRTMPPAPPPANAAGPVAGHRSSTPA
jgi:hypothetical protein